MRRGVGFDFPLELDGAPLPVDAAIDWMRTDGITDFEDLSKLHEPSVDSHQNSIIDAVRSGFDPSATPSDDHSLFGVLSMLIHGGGFPWFEDVLFDMTDWVDPD
jgi:hypothetical protein